MKGIKSAEMYLEKCQRADEGDIMARLEVNAHRVRVFVADLSETLFELVGEDKRWEPALSATQFLAGYVTGLEGRQNKMEEQAYDPSFALNQTGLIANRLHELQGDLDEIELASLCACWEKLSHTQYLLGTLYPNYIAVLKEARALWHGGLKGYSERMQYEANAILND